MCEFVVPTAAGGQLRGVIERNVDFHFVNYVDQYVGHANYMVALEIVGRNITNMSARHNTLMSSKLTGTMGTGPHVLVSLTLQDRDR